MCFECIPSVLMWRSLFGCGVLVSDRDSCTPLRYVEIMCWKTIFSLTYRIAFVAPAVAKAELLLFFGGVFSSANVVGKSVSLLYSWLKLRTKKLKRNVLKLWLKSKALKFLFNLKTLES